MKNLIKKNYDLGIGFLIIGVFGLSIFAKMKDVEVVTKTFFIFVTIIFFVEWLCKVYAENILWTTIQKI